MSKAKFPILGTEIPPMMGREGIVQQLWNNLTKTTPDHISVVGPRFAGKSVILKELAKRLLRDDKTYCSVIYWDLGHQTPRTDEEFIKKLCRRLGEGLEESKNEYGGHLLSITEDEYEEISDVLELLSRDGQKILMLWDGFDKPLSEGLLTRNLWDNLLELCKTASFRLVTSTRKELHQLIRDEKSVTSDFWGVFGGVIRVGIFDEQDINSILAKLPDFTFQGGARAELSNWSGRFPPLLLAVLNQLVEANVSGQIDNKLVNEAAAIAIRQQSAMIDRMWRDCPAKVQDLYMVLAEKKEILFKDAGKEERAVLLEKGFAEEVGNKLRVSCQMLNDHISGAGPDSGSMARLFGTWDNYHSNIRSLLERRLSHISHFDDRLYRCIELSINLIPKNPELSLAYLTDIEERALDLIWQYEFGAPRIILPEIISYWTKTPRDSHKIIKNMMETNTWIVPNDNWGQVGLLQLLTGSSIGFDSKAKGVSKDTYVLINAIHSYRNRKQHGDGQTMHLGVAVAAMMTCLELLACLDRELH